MVDENACKGFVEHQEFLAMKAQKKASERHTLPNIDWNNEFYVKSSDRVFSFETINVQNVVNLVKGIDGGKATGLDN